MPEDRRLALAAVIVTGAVGLGAPVFSMIAAREVQEDALQANRSQSDLAELRGVFDVTAAQVPQLQVAAQAVGDAWRPSGRSDWRTPTFERRFRQFQSRVDEMRRNYYRLRLRLGSSAEPVLALDRLYKEAIGLLELLDQRPHESSYEAAERRYRQIRSSRDDFLLSATELVGSEVD